MKLSKGKIKGMQAVADKHGVIAAAAMDQRGSLSKSLAKEKGVPEAEITQEMMGEFKTAVTRILTPYASAILLDPEFGLGAAKKRAKKTGLLLAYEKTGYDNSQPGRIPTLLNEWSVMRLKEAGADCIKLLIHYTPFDADSVNDMKKAMVERIGAECSHNDIPFFLEFVGYDPKGGDEKGPEYAKIKPQVVIGSMQEFTKPKYGVDVLKVEVPVNTAYVEGTRAFKGPAAQTRKEALQIYRKAAKVATKPFIYLSAGVSNAQFNENLELAAEAGVKFNGVLCGRATWKDGVPIYAKEGLKKLEDWLADEGVKNIQAVNKSLETATPWYKAYGAKSAAALA